MTFEQAKSLAAIGYPQPETKVGTAWVAKHAPTTLVSFDEVSVQFDQRMTTLRLINELRNFGDAYYVPTREEMLRVLSEFGSKTETTFHLRMYHGYDAFYVNQVEVKPNGLLGEITRQACSLREHEAYLAMILQLAEGQERDLLLKCAREVQHWMTNNFSF